MATISENLEALQTAKTNIKTAIENKGQDLTDVPFTQYGEKIADIQTKEDLDTELNEQDELLAELEGSVNELPDKDIDLSTATATVDDILEGKTAFTAEGEVTGTYKDMLQQWIDKSNGNANYLFYYYTGSINFVDNLDTSSINSMKSMCAYCTGTTIDLKNFNTENVYDMTRMFEYCRRLSSLNISGFNTSNVRDGYMVGMFNGCEALTELDLRHFNTSKVTSMYQMFTDCGALRSLNLEGWDTSNVTIMGDMFRGCEALTSLNLSSFNTSKVTNMSTMFGYCFALERVEGVIDMLSNTSVYTMFSSCRALTEITLKNIKISLQIGSGTSWGHLLTLDTLLNTIKELWTNTGTSTLTLTVGSANLEKLANVYVKLIDITDEMRAEDEYIDNKAPFEVCKSTDDGAMLITEYVTTVKKWQLA